MSFELYLKENIPSIKSFHPYFNDAIKLMLDAGGKHFRAKLLLGVVESLNKDKLKDAYAIAFAIEMMHTYSLIHDDLPSFDNADFRRGIPTIHKKYDEVSAILVGDGLNTEAFLHIANSNFDDSTKVKLVKELSYNAGFNGMVIGQALDCYFEKQKLDIKELEFIHIHKTGRLIAASLKMGAILSGLDEKECEKYYEIGLKLGLIFQINDDILDATKDDAELGKPSNNDTFKNSYTNLLGVDKAIKYKKDMIDELYELLSCIDEKVADNIKKLIEKYL